MDKAINIIKVNNVVFDYANKRALKNISFGIEKNSIVGLVGPNGAGKTTLLRCLAGLDSPLSGNIIMDGIDVIENPRLCHQKIGYLSDFFGLYDELTITQHLEYMCRAHHLDLVTDKIARILEDVELVEHANKNAAELSRGLRQRLGIAMSIIHNPEFLLLDEPASGLDPEARYTLSRLLLKLQASGMTIICSSHILAELEEYSSHMLIIEGGHCIGLHLVTKGENMQQLYMEKIQAYRGVQR